MEREICCPVDCASLSFHPTVSQSVFLVNNKDVSEARDTLCIDLEGNDKNLRCTWIQRKINSRGTALYSNGRKGKESVYERGTKVFLAHWIITYSSQPTTIDEPHRGGQGNGLSHGVVWKRNHCGGSCSCAGLGEALERVRARLGSQTSRMARPSTSDMESCLSTAPAWWMGKTR